MIIFRICNVEAGETSPRVEPRAFYKAFLNHINCRNHKSRVHVSTKIVGRDTVKTAYVYDVDANNQKPAPALMLIPRRIFRQTPLFNGMSEVA